MDIAKTQHECLKNLIAVKNKSGTDENGPVSYWHRI
jgi:hypothetical protein